MQLNPARGRKREYATVLTPFDKHAVYAAQPREGTETCTDFVPSVSTRRSRFMQLNPARGRKPVGNLASNGISAPLVYAAQPREGTETRVVLWAYICVGILGLCSSTPRGDGNNLLAVILRDLLVETVYAAQPREGTETCTGRLVTQKTLWRFMQLNSARGRKQASPRLETRFWT